eukprot:7379001-Prymnesium_polylepis.1
MPAVGGVGSGRRGPPLALPSRLRPCFEALVGPSPGWGRFAPPGPLPSRGCRGGSSSSGFFRGLR